MGVGCEYVHSEVQEYLPVCVSVCVYIYICVRLCVYVCYVCVCLYVWCVCVCVPLILRTDTKPPRKLVSVSLGTERSAFS